MRELWSVPREWAGETAFIVGGGPSVGAQNLESLKGRRVIAINSSYRRVPWADFLFFGDERWLREEQKGYRGALGAFKGRIVGGVESQASHKPPVLTLRKVPGKSRDVRELSGTPTEVAYRWTSMTGAINVAIHLGVVRLVLLGADCKPGPNGEIWHHEPHRWPVRRERWTRHKGELAAIVGHLKALGVEVINASPGSALDCWPVMTLEEAIARVDGPNVLAA